MIDYKQLEKQIRDTAKEENGLLPMFSNAAAILMDGVPGLNWVGFYMVDEEGFHLGPFQGKPGRPRIPSGKGLCSLAAKKNDMVYAPDVHEQPEFLPGDPATDSEVIFPLRNEGKVVAVLVMDSPVLNRFSVVDRDNLRRMAGLVEKNTNFSGTEKTAAAEKKAPPKEHSMPFELWLYAIKGMAQTYEMVEPIFSQLSEKEKKSLRDEYEKTA